MIGTNMNMKFIKLWRHDGRLLACSLTAQASQLGPGQPHATFTKQLKNIKNRENLSCMFMLRARWAVRVFTL